MCRRHGRRSQHDADIRVISAVNEGRQEERRQEREEGLLVPTSWRVFQLADDKFAVELKSAFGEWQELEVYSTLEKAKACVDVLCKERVGRVGKVVYEKKEKGSWL